MKKFAVLDSESEASRLEGNRCFREGNYLESKNHYVRSLQLDSGNFKTLNNLGVLLEKLGNFQESLEFYKKACAIIPLPMENANKYFENLGRLSEIVSDKHTALWAYEKTLDSVTDNSYSISVRYLEILKTLHIEKPDSRIIKTLESIAKIPNIDQQVVSDEYLKAVSLDREFCSLKDIETLTCILKRYPLTLHFLDTCLNTNPIIEQQFSILSDDLTNLEANQTITVEQSKILEALKNQWLRSGGVQIFANLPLEITKALTEKSRLPSQIQQQKNNVPLKVLTSRPRHDSLLPSARDKIRSFYEANPYPLWENRPHHIPSTMDEYFASVGLDSPLHLNSKRRILVAGCGTGRHAIQLALTYPDSQVIGIDISLASLRHANLIKSQHSINNVKFIHCSIFDVINLRQKFNIIECVGVLHHIKQQSRALKALLSVLDKNGVIKLGLYSSQARNTLKNLELRCTHENIPYKPEQMHAIRNLAIGYGPQFKNLVHSKDFYSWPGCMDLLFNPQEDSFSIRRIYDTLLHHDLDFSGFSCDVPSTQKPSPIGFGNPRGLKSKLNEWHEFEIQNPYAFSNMYLFWIKPRTDNENN